MIRAGTLVDYKDEPHIVTHVAGKLTIKSADGAERKVREKDVVAIHAGPIQDAGALGRPNGEMETAWQMLAGSVCTLEELCDLAYGDYTPDTAWAAWRIVREGIQFEGTPDAVRAIDAETVARILAEREAKREDEERRRGLIDRIKNGTIEREDRRHLGDVEALARGATDSSTVMRDLGIRQSPERAHELLLRLGVWGLLDNPYPARLGVPMRAPSTPVDGIDTSERRDLTAFTAYAIDDGDTTAADDAVSIDGDMLWVHIADPAAIVVPGGDVEREAQSRGASLHVPDRIVHMLPEEIINSYSLGNAARSPALSFRISVAGDGEATIEEIVPSWVRTERLTYEQAEERLDEPDLAGVQGITRAFSQWRMRYAAPAIDLPEAKIRLENDGTVSVTPVYGRLQARSLVLESMLMVGYGVGRYCLEHEIPIPYSRQDEPDIDAAPDTLSAMWKARRRYKRSEHSTTPGAHAGLGLSLYVQATSPLRRHLDLVTHQQLRAHLLGQTPRQRDEVAAAIGESDIKSADARRAEHLSNRHYTIGYLMQRPEWTGTAVVVATGRNTTVIVPDLAFEAELVSRDALELDEEVLVAVESLRLPTLECYLYPS